MAAERGCDGQACRAAVVQLGSVLVLRACISSGHALLEAAAWGWRCLHERLGGPAACPAFHANCC